MPSAKIGDIDIYLFDQLLEAGATASEAVRRVILDPPWSWNDVDECDAQS